MSWDIILPFLQPIADLLRDPEVTDILANGSGDVWVERNGRLEHAPGVTVSEKALQIAIRHIARLLGDEVSEEQPLLDARLPDGSRVAAVLSTCAVTGTTLAIRKFQAHRYTLDELVRVGTLPPQVAALLTDAVHRRQTILVSGGTGAGKTTLLNALASTISSQERIVVIEDTSEIQIQSRNLVRLEGRREQPGLPAVTVRQLLRATLRLRPDRILVGEIRGEEAFDLLLALNTGHRGTLSTTHANSAGDTLDRFVTCVLMAQLRLAYSTICRQVAHGVELLVHMDRRDGRREVREVVRVKGYSSARDQYDLETLYAA